MVLRSERLCSVRRYRAFLLNRTHDTRASKFISTVKGREINLRDMYYFLFSYVFSRAKIIFLCVHKNTSILIFMCILNTNYKIGVINRFVFRRSGRPCERRCPNICCSSEAIIIIPTVET